MKPRIVKILYVEPGVDEKGGARMLEQSTENTNYSCVFTVVSNGFLGLECSEYTCYDFIIVKKDMQHLGAIDMMNVLKAVGCPTPLVVLLDEHDNCSDYDSNALGFFAALRKPLSTKILSTLIETIVNRYTAAPSSSSSSSYPSSSSNLDTVNQTISLSNQQSSNDDNLNNEQLSASVPVLENPRKGKSKALKNKSVKATVPPTKATNIKDSIFPADKKNGENNSDEFNDMESEVDDDIDRNIVIVKDSRRGSGDRREASSTLNRDSLQSKANSSEFFSLDEELLLMEGIRSSSFLGNKDIPSTGISGGRETPSPFTPSPHGPHGDQMPQGLSSGNWDLRSTQTKQHQPLKFQSQPIAPTNIYDFNRNNTFDTGFIPNNPMNKSVPLSNTGADKSGNGLRAERRNSDKEMDIRQPQENLDIKQGHLPPSQSQYNPPPHETVTEEAAVWDQNTAIQQLVNDWFPYRNTAGNTATTTPNYESTDRYPSLTTLSTAPQIDSRGTSNSDYSNYSYNRNLNSNNSTRGPRTENSAFLLAGLNAKEMKPLNSPKNSPAPSPSMFSYSSLSSAYPPTDLDTSTVNRPELSPFPMSTNFNSSAFTSLPSNKDTDKNTVPKVPQKGAFGRKRAPIDQGSYDNFAEK
eukprot:CAMPEP_0119053004 /NCGR_PEP_ID=MMETSP1177-20130426/74126_1 /TAXON_ID=2985 /ORGANISM="Ochromonas sp, Strain CCMP1899" /LENGTH=636 /DNA_ID=CAMNT_0007032785 /DNA_START=96 /DNA_END=2006 /DNA_ORIENTATION=-